MQCDKQAEQTGRQGQKQATQCLFATATKFHISFFPFFLPRITYRHVRCPFVQKEKIKKVSFIKISPFEK